MKSHLRSHNELTQAVKELVGGPGLAAEQQFFYYVSTGGEERFGQAGSPTRKRLRATSESVQVCKGVLVVRWAASRKTVKVGWRMGTLRRRAQEARKWKRNRIDYINERNEMDEHERRRKRFKLLY